jgi:alpha-1,6-mannosyltransferase
MRTADGTSTMDAETSRADPGDRRLTATAVLGFVATTAIVLGALLGGSAYETHLPGAWFFGMPGGLFGSIGSNAVHPPIYAVIAVYGGTILFVRVWIGLLRHLTSHQGMRVRNVVFVVVIWAVPLLLAPPLFSRDVYSYAGQGEMVSHHIDPYTYGTGILGSTPFSTLPDSLWADTPSPYGPTFLAIDGALDKASGHRILADIVLLRLLEVAGLALIVAATPALARRLGRDPAQAVVLGAGCPLVLITFVGGAHNEALMLGLLTAGLAVAMRWGTVPGVVLCAAAAGVKSPALLGVVFLGWAWAGPGASVARRLLHCVGAGLIALVTLASISWGTGNGWGWVRTTTSADKSFTAVTPVNAISKAAAAVANAVDVHFSSMGARTFVSVIGLTLAAAIGIWLLIDSSNHNVPRNLGLTLLVVALLGPILWSWYVTWGVIVLAPAATPALRRVVVAISTFEIFVGISSVKNLSLTIVHAGALPDLILLGALFAIAIIPLGQFGRSRPSLRSAPPDTNRSMIGLPA